MTVPFIDTDVIIRLLTGDDPVNQAAATALFRQAATGEVAVTAPESVIADAVHVLSSPRICRIPRDRVRNALAPLVRLPSFNVRNRAEVLRALDLYGTTRLDFGDASLVAAMERSGAKMPYSYDRHFDRVAGIHRQEP